MEEEGLKQRIAKLESVNDQLTAEIRFLDEIARKLGFEHGLKTLKEAALELLDEQENGTC
jgi:hypothetical protein